VSCYNHGTQASCYLHATHVDLLHKLLFVGRFVP